MSNLDQIKKPISRELDHFEQFFKESMRSRIGLLDKITRYIVKTKGKQMRPMFVLLSATINGGINDSSYRAATLIELLHTATLVHDDVVDDSNERRGFFSINALWKNKISVLVGDFLLSRGLLLALDHGDFELLKIVSEAVKAMSEGELLQIEKARRMDIEEPVYFEIITKKTASLIASCCAVGAASAGADKAAIDRMRQFGINVGIAFQIKDDIFDYQLNSQTGKPSGIDIKERKMTLPLIYLLNQSGLIEKRRIIHTVKRHGNNPEKVASLIQKVQEAGGIAYAEQQMQHYVNLALEQLEGLPDSEALDALKQMVEFTVSRKK
ncbi:MAG: polyprenyl synthetase family protein [Bacteroidetes bacterium]|nr:polyprenyl synthetase family protein [Bacteroidota bacterium]MBU1580432.1 polyprenyl synthetase family protein [Bacteroidota bacterium]MBU2465084.1 polyprenyl synthetase family protein [Bacteroidota bacterium]MBU2558779.1 polyprenyl synthetase family protein [Bacteroidota bacterium]